MRGKDRWKENAICLIRIGFFCCILWGIFAGTSRSGLKNILVAEEEGVSVKGIHAEEAKKEEPIDFTAWREVSGQKVSDKECLVDTTATQVWISGSSEYLIPCGKILSESDKEGCLIGEKTAEQLFGTHAAEGLTVLVDDREFVIRGVLKKPAEVLICQEPDENGIFDRIVLHIRKMDENGIQSSRAVMEKFKNTYGFHEMLTAQTDETVIEQVMRLLPGKWSDFSGWKNNLEGYWKEQAQVRRLAKSIFD